MQRSYEVLRFVGQNGRFHIVMDCVEGELLSTFVQNENSMSKKLFFCLMIQLAKELEALEKSNAEEYIPYLTPFHIVIKEDQSLAILKDTERYHKKYENLIDQFMPLDGSNNYFYSYGRILQYVLMKVRLRPRLTKLEEYKLKKIISKCMEVKQKKQFKNAREIANKLGSVKKSKKIFRVVVFLLGIGLLSTYFKSEEDSYQKLQAYMTGNSVFEANELDVLLKSYEEEKGDSFSLSDREWMLEVCYRVNTDYSRQQLKVHSEALFKEVVAKRELLANLYLEAGEIEQAAEEYKILIMESPTAERYLVLSRLLDQCERDEEAIDVCQEGCMLFTEREELQLQYVKLLVLSDKYLQEEKSNELAAFLKMYPNLEKSEDFIRLKQELGLGKESGDV